MLTTDHLIQVADAYKAAAGIDRDQTVSYRVFRDTKKLGRLRSGAGITVTRLNSALLWFMSNWPDGQSLPDILAHQQKEAS